MLSTPTLAFFSPSPLVSIGQRGPGLPLAPWALQLCWWSPELGSHSKRDLLRGEAGVGTKRLLGSGPSKYQYPSMELRTEAPSHPLLKILFRELHSGKVDSPQGTNHSPNAPLLSKATLAFFSPSPLVSIGQRGSGLPLAPWALLLCWWSPEVESHSKRVPLREYTGVGKKMNSGRWPQQTSGASFAAQHRTPISPMTQNSIEGAAFWKGRLSLGNKPQPQCAFAQQSNACLFLP